MDYILLKREMDKIKQNVNNADIKLLKMSQTMKRIEDFNEQPRKEGGAKSEEIDKLNKTLSEFQR
jgi:hypothetical protein